MSKRFRYFVLDRLQQIVFLATLTAGLLAAAPHVVSVPIVFERAVSADGFIGRTTHTP